MPDVPALTRRQLVWSLVCSVLVAVAFAVISEATGGVVGLVTNGVAVLGASLAVSAARELYRLRYPSRYPGPGGEGAGQVYALGLLAVFFAAAGSFISWAMEDPGSGCTDCDTPSGHMVALGVLIASWGAAGFLAWRMVRLRREQGRSRQYGGR